MEDTFAGGPLVGLGKATAKAAFDALSLELARRGAEETAPSDYDGFDDLLNEALDTLAGAGGDGFSAALASFKAQASGRPEAFSYPYYRAWIGHDRSRALVKEAVQEWYGAHDREAIATRIDALADMFAEVTGERRELAFRPAADAIAFVLRSIERHLKKSDQAVIGILSAQQRGVQNALKALGARDATTPGGLSNSVKMQVPSAPGASTVEALGRDLERRLIIAERSLGFMETWTPELDPFAALAREALEPNSAPEAVRRRVLLRATRSAALRGALTEAEEFFATAEALDGPADAEPARARLLQARGETDEAIRLLRDRTDPDSASTLLDILRLQKGDAWLVEQARNGTCLPENLTASGVLIVAEVLAAAGEDELLGALLGGVSAEQTDSRPSLLYIRAFNQVALILPSPDRYLVRDGNLPLDLSPLARAAARVLGRAEENLKRRLDSGLADLARLTTHLGELGLTSTQKELQAARLIFRLMHPDRKAEARRELEARLARPRQALVHIPPAIAFLQDFDPVPFRTYLANREEIGGLDTVELRAAFALALHSAAPRELVEFVGRHREPLEQSIGKSGVASVEIQALAAAGDAASARILFDASVPLLDPNAVAFLQAQIAKAEGEDPVTAQIALYDKTQDIDALRTLVGLLASLEDKRALARYAHLLFKRTESLADARSAARAMAAADEVEDFRDLIKQVPDILEHDQELKLYYASDLIHAGRLKEAQRIIREVRMEGNGDAVIGPGSPEFDLEVTVAIDTGDWDGLARLLGELLEQRDRLSGPALIQAAQLAKIAGFPVAKPLIEAAVAQAPDNAGVLAGAYLLHHEIGAEKEYQQEAQHWFQRALELSDEAGPLHSINLRDLLAQEQDWQRHIHDVSDKVAGGELPLAVAAPALRLTLTHTVLRNLVRNSDIKDLRDKAPVPLFPGKRIGAVPLPKGTRIGLDITAVLTLGYLGLLDAVIKHYPGLIISAGVMRQLFEERQRMLHHQRSRVERARHIQNLLVAPGGLKLTHSDKNQSRQIPFEGLDSELADLLAAARRTGGVVVRPAPVHAVGSLGEIPVDMTPHRTHLCDTRALLRVLVQTGRLDERTEATARRFFDIQDEGWADGVDPDPSAPLYLDSLTIGYLQTVGLLNDVLATFDSVYVHEAVKNETIALLAYEGIGEQVIAVVDRIRRTLNDAYERDAIVFGPIRAQQVSVPSHGSDRTQPRPNLPEASSLINLFSMLNDVDILLVDDRWVAALGTAADEAGGSVPIGTTLDVLDALRDRELLDDADWRHHRFMLRKAGAALVPLSAEEVLAAARRSAKAESLELRALRESIALARLRKLPRFPAEIPWFHSVATSVIESAQQAFATLPADQSERAASYCYSLLPNPADWAALWPGDGGAGSDWVDSVDRILHQKLVTVHELEEGPARDRFKAWLDREVLQPMRVEEPGRYDRLVQALQEFIRLMVEGNDEES